MMQPPTAYPLLRKLLQHIAADNDYQLKEPIPAAAWPANAQKLEQDATVLNSSSVDQPDRYATWRSPNDPFPYEDEFELLACGEDSDQDILIERKQLASLASFCEEAFEGSLMTAFFTID